MSDNGDDTQPLFEVYDASEKSDPPAQPPEAHTPPADDRMARLEERLERMAGSVSQVTREAEARAAENELRGRRAQYASRVAEAEAKQAEAEDALTRAYEDGDSAQIARASRQVSEAAAMKTRAQAEVDAFDNQARAALEKAKAQPRQPDRSRLDAWKQRNQWWGVDPDLTQSAHDVDKDIRRAGVIPVGSNAYFQELDRVMRIKHPDKFGGSPQTTAPRAGSGQSSSQGGAPQMRVPRHIVEGWRRMGLNVNDPNVAKELMKGRRSAVERDILPAEPAYGPIITERGGY